MTTPSGAELLAAAKRTIDPVEVDRVYAALPTHALSVQQPWAWLIVHGWKDVENRVWATGFRGRFLVHAGINVDHDAYAWLAHRFPDIPIPRVLPSRGIVGAATLTDCVRTTSSPWHAIGQHGFLLEDAVAYPTVPVRGHLRFFSVDDAARRLLAERLVLARAA